MAPYYKHQSNFRNSAAVKELERIGSPADVLALYKLREVIAEHCSEENNYSTVLRLEPPQTEDWLAQEILQPPQFDDGYGSRPADRRELAAFLEVASNAGVIHVTNFESENWTVENKQGERVPMICKEIEVVGLAKNLRDYANTCQRGKR